MFHKIKIFLVSFIQNKDRMNKAKEGLCLLESNTFSSKVNQPRALQQLASIFIVLCLLGFLAMQCGGAGIKRHVFDDCRNGDQNSRGDSCVSCDAGFSLSEEGTCNPIPGASCANGQGSAGACTSCDTGFFLSGASCLAQVIVSFDLNGGSGTLPAKRKVVGGQEIVVPDMPGASKAGFVFIGWSTLRTNVGPNFIGKGGIYETPRVTTPNLRVILYATWGANYRVTYNLNGGLGSDPVDSDALMGNEVVLRSPILRGLNHNRPLNASTSPSNGFFGWGVNTDGTGLTYDAGSSQLFASNTILYALWYYPISYNCGEGTQTIIGNFPTVKSEGVGADLSNLPKTGCSPNLADGRIFAGWSTTGMLPLVTTMPNGPLSLKAVYYIVDVDSDGLIEISTAEELNNMRYNLAGTSYKVSAIDTGSTLGCPVAGCNGYELTTSIDFATTKWGTSTAYTGSDRVAEGWEPIGTNDHGNEWYKTTKSFTATFEGNGFVIRNLYINRPNSYDIGLFGVTSGALNQVALESVVVLGPGYVGGLTGIQYGGSITHSYVTGVVVEGRSANFKASTTSIGGLVGYQYGGGRISHSYTTSRVISDTYGYQVGGLVGSVESSTINYSYATGTVMNKGIDTGGLVGAVQSSTINNSYATGDVTGINNTGGFMGRVSRSAISNNYTTGAVTALVRNHGPFKFLPNHAGGLVGELVSSTINNSYATGVVTGGHSTGGLVGDQYESTIKNSYAIGTVTGTVATTGGLLGRIGGVVVPSVIIKDSYWNTGAGVDRGVGNDADASGVIGLSTAEIQATTAPYPNLLGSCFKLTSGRYPQLYTWDESASACTTTLLAGPNAE